MNPSIQAESPFWKERLTSLRPLANNEVEITKQHLKKVVPSARRCSFSPEELDDLERLCSRIASDMELLTLWAVIDREFASEHMAQAASNNPQFSEEIAGNTAAFVLTAALAQIPLGDDFYRKKGWPDTIYQEGLKDFKIWADDYRKNFSRFGINWSGSLAWCLYHIDGRVIQLGRLQCNLSCAFYDDIQVYRHRLDKRIQAVVNGEFEFTKHGLYAFDQDERAFRTALPGIRNNTLIAHGITREGFVLSEKLKLPLTEWELILSGGDPVINLHIPADGPLTPEACADSMQRMKIFFDTHLPNYGYKAFVCESWLLDPQLANLLPAHSNILAFQRMGHLLYDRSKSDAVTRVFGIQAQREGLHTVPHDNSLKRILVGFHQNGGIFRNGRFFAL